MKNPVTLLRRVALLEAVSYLVLLGIAMPLKYVWKMPMAVSVVGMIHGALFVVLCWALLQVMTTARWPLKHASLVFVASLLPFVPFFLDRWMRMREEDFTARELAD
jgi:integral membrane protein